MVKNLNDILHHMKKIILSLTSLHLLAYPGPCGVNRCRHSFLLERPEFFHVHSNRHLHWLHTKRIILHDVLSFFFSFLIIYLGELLLSEHTSLLLSC